MCIRQVQLTKFYIIFGHMLLILVCAVLSYFTAPQAVNKWFEMCLECDSELKTFYYLISVFLQLGGNWFNHLDIIR